MSLWATRKAAGEALRSTLKPQADCLDQVFALIDEAIGRLYPPGAAPALQGRELAAIAAPIAIKGRNYTLGIFSLVLDGLAQEAGGLLRPLLEVIELLAYLQKDRENVVKVMNGKKPSPGRIAAEIGSGFKRLREALNQDASHLGLSDIALGHVIGVSESGWPVLLVVQPYREANVRANLETVFMFAINLTTEILNCAVAAGIDVDEALRARVDRCRDEGLVTMHERGNQERSE